MAGSNVLMSHFYTDNLFLLFVYSLLLLLVIYFLFVPINLNKNLSEASQDRVQRSHPVPPVFPNGWIPVAETLEVNRKQVTKCKLHVHELILIRGDNNQVEAYDAFCPHLGAHLGFSSEIVHQQGQSCIRCPFHGWLFSASTGSCVLVPYAKDQKPPGGVKLKKWPCVETCGFIFVWFHADGLEANWLPPVLNEINSGQWSYGGRTQDMVNCHLQEIPENGADVGHLKALHAPSILCGGNFTGWWRNWWSLFFLGCHEWDATWSPGIGHIAKMTLNHKLTLFGITIYNLILDIEQIGPAMVILKFNTPSWGGSRGAYIQAVMPQASNKQKIVHLLFQEKGFFTTFLSRFMLWSQSNMLERDVQVWQKKRFLKTPALVKEDKAIVAFRNWYSQFYSENSPRSFATPLDW